MWLWRTNISIWRYPWHLILPPLLVPSTLELQIIVWLGDCLESQSRVWLPRAPMSPHSDNNSNWSRNIADSWGPNVPCIWTILSLIWLLYTCLLWVKNSSLNKTIIKQSLNQIPRDLATVENKWILIIIGNTKCFQINKIFFVPISKRCCNCNTGAVYIKRICWQKFAQYANSCGTLHFWPVPFCHSVCLILEGQILLLSIIFK